MEVKKPKWTRGKHPAYWLLVLSFALCPSLFGQTVLQNTDALLTSGTGASYTYTAPGTSGGGTQIRDASQQPLWYLAPNPFGLTQGNGHINGVYTGTGTVQWSVNLTNLNFTQVNAYPFLGFGHDVWGFYNGNQGLTFPVALTNLNSLVTEVQYSLAGQYGTNMDVLFDLWLAPSTNYNSGSAGAVEIEILPFNNYPGYWGTFVKTVTMACVLNGQQTNLSFLEYDAVREGAGGGQGAGTTILFYPIGEGTSSGDWEFDAAVLIKEAAATAGVSDWCLPGFQLGTEFGRSSSANFTFTLNKCRIQMTTYAPQNANAVVWLGGNAAKPNDWNTAANWQGGVKPTSTKSVFAGTVTTVNSSTLDLAGLNWALTSSAAGNGTGGTATGNGITNAAIKFGSTGGINTYTLTNGAITPSSEGYLWLSENVTLNFFSSGLGGNKFYWLSNAATLNIMAGATNSGRFVVYGGAGSTATVNVNAANYATDRWLIGPGTVNSSYATNTTENLTVNINANQVLGNQLYVAWSSPGTNTIVVRNGATVTNNGLTAVGATPIASPIGNGRLVIGDATTRGSYSGGGATGWFIGGYGTSATPSVGIVDVVNGTLTLNNPSTIRFPSDPVNVTAYSMGMINLYTNGTLNTVCSFASQTNTAGIFTGTGIINFNGGRMILNTTGAQATNVIDSSIAVNVLDGGGIIDLNGKTNAIYATLTSGGTGAGVLTITNSGTVSAMLTNKALRTGLAISGGTVIVPPGGSLYATNLAVGYNQANSQLTAMNGSAVSVGGGSGNNLWVGYADAGSLPGVGTLDVSALTNFTVNVGKLRVGYNAGVAVAGTAGTLLLATNNRIIATNMVIGFSGNAQSGMTHRMTLGAGTNVVETPVWVVGGQKETGILDNPSGGTLILTNSGGNVDLSVGREDANSSQSAVGMLDVTNGAFSGNFGPVMIGGKSLGGSGGATGTLNIGANANNNVTATNMVIGSLSGAGSSGAIAQGTLNFGGGSFTVNGNVTLGAFDGGLGSAIGRLNINGGTFGVTGNITNGGGGSALNISGGVLNLSGGTLTVGSLTGNGVINGATIVPVGGVIDPGLGGADTSTLTISNSLILAGGAVFTLNRDAAQNSSRIAGLNTVTYGGTLTVTNAGSPLIAGDTFTLFQAAAYHGGFSNIILPTLSTNLKWNTDHLAVNGVVSVETVPSFSLAPVEIGVSVSSSGLTLSWPADHLGWRLLVQTNNVSKGISANIDDWETVPGSTNINQTNIMIDPALPAEYYRIATP